MGIFAPGAGQGKGIAVVILTHDIQPPDQQLTGGLGIAGTGKKRVLIRGIGPRLVDLGVADALSDSTLGVVNAA